jgi:diguanylate cyclase (GGDEF)-like protein
MPDTSVDDVLVFRWTPDAFRLIGGRGRGAGWANIVEVGVNDSESMSRAWRSGVPVRISEPTKVNVGGPYWAAQAIVVPVGQEHLVVFGGAIVERHSEAAFVAAAARAVAETGDASAEKLLSDELEVVHALRSLMAYQPTSVRETARHIATVAARALSCEVAAVHVRTPSETTLDIMQIGSGSVEADPNHAGRDAEPFLKEAARNGLPIVEQTVGPDPEIWTDKVVSRMTLPIGRRGGLGAISLGHAEGHERGFTTLCQRIGRTLAESAEPLLQRAIEHEQLATERELYARATRTDPLTGVGNRAAWEQFKFAPPPLSVSRGRRPLPTSYTVLTADLDNLKSINDEHGHSAGDAALRAGADFLRFSLRPTDALCRIGGDEFLAILPNVDEREAQRIVRRLRAAMNTWRNKEHAGTPSLSIGWAVVSDGWDEAVALADQRMYDDKRRHDLAAADDDAGAPSLARPTRRRSDPVPTA